MNIEKRKIELIVSQFKIYYKGTVIKIMCYWHKTEIDLMEHNRGETRATDYLAFIFDGCKNNDGKDDLFQ